MVKEFSSQKTNEENMNNEKEVKVIDLYQLNNAIEMIRIEFPEKAIDIIESLELLQSVISDTVDTIGRKLQSLVNERQFGDLDSYSRLSMQGHSYEKKIADIIDLLEVEEIVEDMEEDEKKIREMPNYMEYVVDNNVEHTLYEDFKHKRPFGFKFNTLELIETNSWSDMFIRISEILVSLNEEKFLSFEMKPSMNGKINQYFSKDMAKLKKPYKINDSIYIDTNQNANGIRNLIIKMLKEYDFKASDFKVYFRADYTNLKR
ncbi:hypothetical protein [Planococcus donghaensis]|uniref:hypothetical protein n=1 Tax=Planococcus donghaensis TaxID=414778 RepID=UPI0037358E2D